MFCKENPLKLKGRLLIALVFLLSFGCTNSNRKVQNIESFAKVYGYVRWFYPSDEAASIDWDKFAVYGVRKVENAGNEEELKQKLIELFKPIAPAIQIENEKIVGTFNVQTIIPKDTAGLKCIAWKHYGVYLGKQSNVYKSLRINRESIQNNVTQIYTDTSHTAKIGQYIKKEIGNHLICTMPISLYGDKEHTYPIADHTSLQQLTEQLDRITISYSNPDQEIKKTFSFKELIPKLFISPVPKNSNIKSQNNFVLNKSDYKVRLANVVIAWNVFQHFYPYFDIIKVDWEKELKNTLNDTYNGKSEADYFKILSKLVAKLEDGHGIIFNDNVPRWGLPILVNFIEKKIVVIASSDTLKFKVGDIIETIDGKSALKELSEQESLISGSPQLRRFRALNVFGTDFNKSNANIQIIRKGKQIQMNFERYVMRDILYNSLFQYSNPVFANLGDSIFYLNNYDWNNEETLKKLVGAKAVIINLLYKPSDFISHIVLQPVWSARWNIPISAYPDRINTYWDTAGRWQIRPKEPNIKAKLVFLTHPYDISSGETYLGIVDYYKLGKLVGDSTAGTNGNYNSIPLMGGYSIWWTGMKVLKHDGSQHHLVGFQPDYPVKNSLQAVKEGKDVFLEKALEVARHESGIQ
jgi:hypothetical protein